MHTGSGNVETNRGAPVPSRRLPSPALVVACLALLVALGGTGYAAVVLPRDSVGPVQIRTGGVTSIDVRDASLREVDLSPAARRALAGRTGPQGPAGPQGAKGDPGPAGIGGIEVVRASSEFVSSPEQSVVVDCPPGKRLLGGGAGAWGRAMIWIPRGVALTANQAVDEDTWVAKAQEVTPTEESWFLNVTVVCGSVS